MSPQDCRWLGSHPVKIASAQVLQLLHLFDMFSRGQFGQNYIWPNKQSLKDLFEYYEESLWYYYVGSTLQTEAERKNFIIGLHWNIMKFCIQQTEVHP